MRFLAAVEDRPQAVCATGAAGRERGTGGEDRWQSPRSVACKPEPGSEHRPVKCRSRLAWTPVFGRGSLAITNRTAVYGSVRTVVGEGRRSDPSPYPDPRSTRDSLPRWPRVRLSRDYSQCTL